MGSWGIFNVGLGRTAEEAHSRLVKQALYEHGHDPYSGTIAAKNGAPLLCPPASGRLTAERIRDLAQQANHTKYVKSKGDDVPTAEAKQARKRLAAWLASGAPGAYRTGLTVDGFMQAYNDKWDGGVCVEITGSHATAWRKRLGKPGTRQRVWAFFGYAPC